MSDHGPGQSSARTVPAGVAPLKRRPPRSCRNVTLGSPPLVCPMDWKLPWHTYGFFIVSSSSSSSSSVGRLLFLCSARSSPRLTALSSAKRSVSGTKGSAYFEPRESPFPFCSSGILFLTSYLFLATSFSFSRIVSRKIAASHSVSATSSGRVSAPVGIPMYILVPEAEGHVPNGGKR